MKRLLLAIAFALPATASAKEVTWALDYTGWHCARCGGRIEASVEKLKGVKSATATLDRVTVTFDDAKTNLDAIKAAITGAGPYTVKRENEVVPATPAPTGTATPAPTTTAK